MINDKLINRINELARKKRETGLSKSEKEEQARLRSIYLKGIRAQVKNHLAGVRFINKPQ